MPAIDAYDIAAGIMINIKNATKRYLEVVALMSLLKASDGHMLTQDDDNVYLEFVFNKPKGIYEAKQ